MKHIRNLAAIFLISLATTILAGCAATVSTPPPAARVEVHPPVPFHGAIWINGHYVHRHGRYNWVPGHYVKPPHRGAVWVPGHWRQHRRGWKWNKGYWK